MFDKSFFAGEISIVLKYNTDKIFNPLMHNLVLQH